MLVGGCLNFGLEKEEFRVLVLANWSLAVFTGLEGVFMASLASLDVSGTSSAN